MGGLARKMPLTARAFVIGALALAGMPGLSGFFSKDLVLEAVEGKLGYVPWVALLFTAFLTAFYMGRVVFVAFFGKPSGEKAEHAHEPGWSMRGPLVVLAVLVARRRRLRRAVRASSTASRTTSTSASAPSLAAALGPRRLRARVPRLRRRAARDGAGVAGVRRGHRQDARGQPHLRVRLPQA